MRDCGQLHGDYFAQMKSWAKENTVPLTATFELTPFCNFNCVMCYVHLTPEQAKKQGEILTAAEWLDIARQAKEMGTLNLCLTGGEPLSHPEFWDIYSELNKMGFLISILSNGSLIDEDMIEKFRMYGMPYSMKITLYGASDETYYRVCGVPDGFTRVSHALHLLKDAGVPLKMTSTIVRENADDLQAIYEFSRNIGIPLQHTITVVKSSRGSTNSAETSRFSLDDFPDELSLDDLERIKFPKLESPFAWCGGYRTSFWMTWNGHLQLCSFMNEPYVKYSGDLAGDFSDLHKKLDKLKSPVECSECEWKIFCQRCPGILCAESGHPERINSSLCNMAKRLHELYRIKVEEN